MKRVIAILMLLALTVSNTAAMALEHSCCWMVTQSSEKANTGSEHCHAMQGHDHAPDAGNAISTSGQSPRFTDAHHGMADCCTLAMHGKTGLYAPRTAFDIAPTVSLKNIRTDIVIDPAPVSGKEARGPPAHLAL